DLEELGAIDGARDRIAAVVVDPVEDADAIFDRIAKGGIAGPADAGRHFWRLLAHLQRQAFLVRVLVHEKRRRKFVARDKPSADERVAESIEVGRMNLEPKPLGEPGDEV